MPSETSLAPTATTFLLYFPDRRELGRLRTAAKAAGMTTGAYIREAALRIAGARPRRARRASRAAA